MFKFLTSFHYYRTSDLTKITRSTPLPVWLFGDSGAFSAASQGADVALDDYDDWLTRWRGVLTVYSNLDVIGDPVATMVNQRELERRGHRPLPVFHVGSPWSDLERLCEEYPYVALGGMVPHAGANLGPWLVRCFKIADKYQCRYHGFGQTRQEYLRDFPWYSVDSSSWGKSFRFGQLEFWDDRSKRFITIPIGDRDAVYASADLIREHGGDPDVFANRELYRRPNGVKIAAVAWLRYEQFLRRRHGEITLRTPTPTAGPHLYLVGAAEQNHQTIRAAISGAHEAPGLHLYFANTGMPNLTDAASIDPTLINKETT